MIDVNCPTRVNNAMTCVFFVNLNNEYDTEPRLFASYTTRGYVVPVTSQWEDSYERYTLPQKLHIIDKLE